nr:hypothetical protein [Brevibacillus laterosporus]
MNTDNNVAFEDAIWELAKLLKQENKCEESKEKIEKIKDLLHN